MVQVYHFRVTDTRDGSTILPVAGDPTYIITGMNLALGIGNTAIAFFDGAGDPVTPTAGTVQFQATPIEGIWLEPPTEATIDATTVLAEQDGVASYTLPTFDGPVAASRLIFTGITGAVSARAYHWRGD